MTIKEAIDMLQQLYEVRPETNVSVCVCDHVNFTPQIENQDALPAGKSSSKNKPKSAPRGTSGGKTQNKGKESAKKRNQEIVTVINKYANDGGSKEAAAAELVQKFKVTDKAANNAIEKVTNLQGLTWAEVPPDEESPEAFADSLMEGL